VGAWTGDRSCARKIPALRIIGVIFTVFLLAAINTLVH
jgi:hypothetical protein